MAAHTVRFSDTVAALPSTGPADHAHIIDITSYTPPNGNENSNMQLQDAVVTMLHQIPLGTSTALTQFTDPAQPTFMLIQNWVDPRNTDKLVICKRGNNVIVGVFTEHEAENCFEFDQLVHFAMNPNASGSWSMEYTSYRDYFNRNWDDVWARRTVDKGFTSLNMQALPGNDPMSVWGLFPFQLASIIMSNKLWDVQTSQWNITLG